MKGHLLWRACYECQTDERRISVFVTFYCFRIKIVSLNSESFRQERSLINVVSLKTASIPVNLPSVPKLVREYSK